MTPQAVGRCNAELPFDYKARARTRTTTTPRQIDQAAVARRAEARQTRMDELLAGPTARLEEAQEADSVPAAESDELTFVDVRIFPAIGAAGTRSGGLWLAAFRVPYAAVSGWWIVDGDEIPGSAGGGGTTGFGFAFDLS